MKKIFLSLIIVALCATDSFADSNGTLGALLNTETQTLGGPFNHGAAAGSADNSTATADFAGTFNATQITIAGDVTGVLAFNGDFFLNEADFVLTTPAAESFTLGTSAPVVPDTTTGPVAFSTTGLFDPAAPAAVNGTWSFEFIDTFDDGPGADSISTNVAVTLSEFEPNIDTDGSFTLDPLTIDDVSVSVGEFLVEGIFDQYSISLNEAGLFSFVTDEDPAGVSGGDTVDTEIAIFNAAGVQIAYSDDEGNGLYSSITDLSLGAGDYTLVVSGFGSNISSDGDVLLADVTGGTSIGDYTLSASLIAIPEPSALGLLAVLGMIGVTRRQR